MQFLRVTFFLIFVSRTFESLCYGLSAHPYGLPVYTWKVNGDCNPRAFVVVVYFALFLFGSGLASHFVNEENNILGGLVTCSWSHKLRREQEFSSF